uniref:Uncharacterized protein n=1 Tax=Oryza meridionalis TaxID=40149 RepID=A0A0E0EKY8_9ORYZ
MNKFITHCSGNGAEDGRTSSGNVISGYEARWEAMMFSKPTDCNIDSNGICMDDPIVVEQGSLIHMAGPKRGIQLIGTNLIEYDMKIKTGEYI